MEITPDADMIGGDKKNNDRNEELEVLVVSSLTFDKEMFIWTRFLF